MDPVEGDSSTEQGCKEEGGEGVRVDPRDLHRLFRSNSYLNEGAIKELRAEEPHHELHEQWQADPNAVNYRGCNGHEFIVIGEFTLHLPVAC